MEVGDSLFDKWCWENMSKGERRTQNSFQMDQRSHTLKLQERKEGETLQDVPKVGLYQVILEQHNT